MDDQIIRFEKWKAQWSEPEQINVFDYIDFNIHPEDILILAKVLFPAMVEVEGCLFFKEKFVRKNYLAWKQELGGDRKAIEQMINHLHVYDLFGNCPDKISEEVFERVAKVIQVSWQCYFKREYAHKNILVEYKSGEEDYGPTLYVFQV